MGHGRREVTRERPSSILDMQDTLNGCGVFGAGHLVRIEDSRGKPEGMRDFLTRHIEHREAQKKHAENECSTCPINVEVFDPDPSLFVHACDLMILLNGKVERDHRISLSAKAQIHDWMELHQACEQPYAEWDHVCKECPLSKHLRKTLAISGKTAGVTICEQFDLIEPRKNIREKRAVGGEVQAAPKWNNEKESRFA